MRGAGSWYGEVVYCSLMTLDTLIMLSGAFVALLPFLGIPASWDTPLLFIAGVFVIALGITVRRRGLSIRKTNEHTSGSTSGN